VKPAEISAFPDFEENTSKILRDERPSQAKVDLLAIYQEPYFHKDDDCECQLHNPFCQISQA